MILMRMRTASVAAIVAVMTFAGCATSRPDFVVALPNGYQIIRGKSAEPMIVRKSGGVVVPGPVASYTVIRDVVVGVVPPPSTGTAPAPNEKQGYFVLNTRSGEVDKSLAEGAWNEKLKSLNIPPSPELSPPVLPK
jgi:hypothetical protein